MRPFARIPFLVLIAVMVGAAIPQAPMVSHSGMGLDQAPGEEAVFTIGEGGQGLEYTSHVATASDVLDLIDGCGVYNPSLDYNVVFDGFGTGMAPPTLDEYADLVGNARFLDDVSIAPGGELPSAVDHSAEPYFPIVKSQGSQGSCGAWACSYYANGYLQAKDHGWDAAYNGTNTSQLMSPAWVYNKINYGVDSGSNWYRNHAVMSSVGNSDWKTLPYRASDLYSWGNEDAWRIAPRYRVQQTYDLISTSSTMVLKASLAEGWVLPMAFDARQYSHLSDDDIISSVEYNSNAANHANTIVGYNDSITADGEAGAFLIVNSWGKSWSGNGYWWMTYDALKELWWPALRMHDKVDYEPTLLGTLDQSTPASKDSRIYIGTDSGIYSDRVPLWWAGTRAYPSFMALDISELVEDVGLAEFYLSYANGATRGTLSSFEVEWYTDGYDEGNPDLVAVSADTPKQASCTVKASFEGLHLRHASPANGTWHRGIVDVNGTAVESIPRQVLAEDFEGRWLLQWTTEDGVTAGGLDTWGTSLHRKDSGDKSTYCAGSDAGVVLFEDFDEGGFMPAEWTTNSSGRFFQYPFKAVNTGYQGCGGTDYLVATRSDRGAGFNITELLYSQAPANASSFTDLVLRFYVDYDHVGGDEHLRVLYANGSTYPNWTEVANYTADTFGYQSYDLSSQDGEGKVYLAFEYRGTNDGHIAIDDVLLAGNKATYDADMRADMYIAAGDLTSYDDVELAYDYWVDSEAGVDILQAMYRTSSGSPWMPMSNHSGAGKAWTSDSVTIPTNATHVGFRFISDGANVSEGAYLDNVVLTGHQAISSVELSVDGGPWTEGTAGVNWSCEWNTTGLADGRHDLDVRVNYSGAYDQVSLWLNSDNTPPSVTQVWNDSVTTGEDTVLHVSADDPNGISWVQVIYQLNAGTEVVLNATSPDNVTWHFDLPVPLDAVDLWYRFHLVDGIGNEVTTDQVQVHVMDNDDPGLGTDLTPEVATTGDPLTFSIIGEDNIMVREVTLEYWYDDLPSVNVTQEGAGFDHTIDIKHTLDPVRYRFTVEDTSGNSVTSAMKEVPVVDDDLPVFGPDGTPGETVTGGNVTLSISVDDNVGLQDTWVVYRFGDGEPANGTLVLGSGGNWTLTVDVPWDSIEPLIYAFWSTDTSGNANSTTEARVTVVDEILPWLGADTTPANSTTGDPLTLVVDLQDNIEVDKAWIEYWYGDGGVHREVDLAAAEGVTWTVTLTIADTAEKLHYMVHMEDTYGNTNVTMEAIVDVVDDDAPKMIEDASPAGTTTGVSYAFNILVEDNLEVSSVAVTWWFDGDEPTTSTMKSDDLDQNWNGTYTLTMDIPSDSTDPLHYSIDARDGAGNRVSTGEVTVPVLDVTLPSAVAGDDIGMDQHQRLDLDGTMSYDNVGITTFTWTVEWANTVVSTMDGSTASMVLDDAGLYVVILEVVDPSGNTDTDTVEVMVYDITPPIVDAGGDKVVDQNVTLILDGTGSTDNVGIKSWTWTFDYDGVGRELSGQDNQFTFYNPGVYHVTLVVVDRAGNTNSSSVVITVKDVIDPRPLTQGDLEGRIDESVRFNGSGSLDNVGIVNWTWSVDLASGRTVYLYGEEVEFELSEPGDHRVTLTVSDADGNTVVSDPFNVHVPNTQLWLMLLVIIIASVLVTTAVALLTRRKTRKLDQQRAELR